MSTILFFIGFTAWNLDSVWVYEEAFKDAHSADISFGRLGKGNKFTVDKILLQTELGTSRIWPAIVLKRVFFEQHKSDRE